MNPRSIDKKQAQELIKETFENPFDKGRFTNFIKNLLNRIDESKAFHAHGYVKEGFRGIIKTYERIGTYNSADDKKIDIIIVYLQKGFSLDHARVTQRNFAGRYLADRDNKNAGLFAFVSPEESDWRFSLVTIDYEIVQSKAGNWKGQEKFSQARRWSFLVGANEKSHTAQSRLVNMLKETDPKYRPTLQEIENTFDIETVTKEFFREYRELFLRTKEELDRVVKKDPKIRADFDDKGVDTVNFAKKLLGQIVFLYFLQKKGWFGVGRDDVWGTGSKHFLRELFEKKHADYNNFFNDILEPLFYEALRIDRSHDDGYYNQFNCKIPFLNGGLFDPIGNYDWVKTDIIIPDKLFSNKIKTDEGDKGTGILDVFDRYNFTVKEDEPLEKEVAIDPELLGKSYEKFNAIRPDNYDEFKKALKSGKKGEENKFNKKFGVYYTPREIVHYMCQQSLINYLATELSSVIPSEARNLKEDIETLIHTGEQVSENEVAALIKGQNIKEGKQKTSGYELQLPESVRSNAALIDQKLADITVCDPAVGSGAFPVGMMSEIVRARNVVSIFLNDNSRTAYEFKRRCIEHSLYGVDIDPGAVEIAKLRLWLSLVVDEEDIKNIKPLPNLDYRIMQGNSLISEFMGINFDSEKEKSSENLMFKDEADELIEQFQQKKDEFLNESNVTRKSKLKEEVDDLLVKIFETKLITQKADYFNRLKNIENKYSVLPDEKQKNEYIKKDKEKLYKESGFDLESAEKQLKEFTSGKKIKPFFLWNLYFSEVFHNKGGFDVVIANPPYILLQNLGLSKVYIEKLISGYYCAQYKVDTYHLFIEKGISLLHDGGIQAYITPNTFIKNTHTNKLREIIATKTNLLNIILFYVPVFEDPSVDNLVFICKKNNSAKYISDHKISIHEVKTSSFEANIKKYREVPQCKIVHPHYVFSFDATDEESIILSKMEKSSAKLGDIGGTYFGIQTFNRQKYVSTIPKNKNYKPVIDGGNVFRYFISIPTEYLNYRPENIKSGGDWSIYSKRRIAVRQIGRYPEGSICTEGLLTLNTVYNIYLTTSDYDIKYILTLLNSKIIKFYWLKKFYDNKETFPKIKKQPLESIPIKKIMPEKQMLFIELAEKILGITKSDDYLQNPQKQAKVKSLEEEIDQLVYKLYGLTGDEIAIIEGEKK